MSNYFLIADSLKKTIEVWNEKLDSFAGQYMDSPWAGIVVFLVLMAFGFFAINSFSKK